MQMLAKAKEREVKDEFRGIWKLSLIKAYLTGGETQDFEAFLQSARDESKPVDEEEINNKFDAIIAIDRGRLDG